MMLAADSNPFFQIITRFHLLSEYFKSDATLPHVRFIWARSIVCLRQLIVVSFAPPFEQGLAFHSTSATLHFNKNVTCMA